MTSSAGSYSSVQTNEMSNKDIAMKDSSKVDSISTTEVVNFSYSENAMQNESAIKQHRTQGGKKSRTEAGVLVVRPVAVSTASVDATHQISVKHNVHFRQCQTKRTGSNT